MLSNVIFLIQCIKYVTIDVICISLVTYEVEYLNYMLVYLSKMPIHMFAPFMLGCLSLPIDFGGGGNSFSSRHRSFISNICITSVFSSFRSCTFTSFLISFYKSLVLIELNLSIFPFLVGNSVSEIFKSFCIIRSERYSMISLQCLSFTFHN